MNACKSKGWWVAVLGLALGGRAGLVPAQAGDASGARPTKIVVAYAAGGSNDVVARLLAQKLQAQLRRPFIVENRTGGGGIPAAEYAARSVPDGHTLLFGNTTLLAIQPFLRSALPYDPQRDFMPIAVVCTLASVLVVHPELPARSVAELVALAKAEPGKLNYASAGNGTPFHLAAELLKTQTGADIAHVPYKGNAPALLDVMAGRVQLMYANVMEVLPQIGDGRLRALAVNGLQRLPLLGSVPTLAEAGVRDAEAFPWFAMVAPRGVPQQAVATLNAQIASILGLPEVRHKFAELGIAPLGGSVVEAEAFIDRERAKWARMVKVSGAKVDN